MMTGICIPNAYTDMKQNKKTLTAALEEYNIRSIDAERVVLDALERMAVDATEAPRADIILRLKRMVVLGVAALEAESATVSFETAAWQSVAARRGRRLATQRDLRYFVRRMLRVEGVGSRPLRAMNTRECRRLLERAFGSSVHCYRKGRAILHSIFAYGVRQEWCDTNPVSRIEVPPVEETTVEPLSPEAADRLLQAAHLRRHRPMRFSLYLMLYCGLRPAEVQRLRPERDVLWDERQVVVRPVVSKTGGGRMVPLRRVSGLRREDCCIPPNWENRWRALRRAAGFECWVPDVCRHTFASYHAAYYRDLPALQLEMGHRDLSLLRSRYMLPVLKSDAELFWKPGCTRNRR